MNEPNAQCLPALVADQASRTPDRTAVLFKDKRLSYGELDVKANRIAAHLASLDVVPGDRVAVAVSRSLDLVPAVLGISKTGAAYVPIDPDHPKDRLAAVLKDVGARVLVANTRAGAALSPYVEKVVHLERERAIIDAAAGTAPVAVPTPDDLAYVMYTSGSAGTPKGVMITHGNLAYHIAAISERLGITADDSSLLAASISFSASVRQYLVPLCRGGAVVVASAEQLADPLSLMDAVERHGVSLLHLVPSHLKAVAQALGQLEPAERARLIGSKLRLVLTASEVLTADVVASFFGLGSRAALVNMYGLTETTGVFAFHPVDKAQASIPIGTPMAGAEIHILDDELHPVAAGAPGELYLGGPLVGRGYWNRADLTDEKFIVQGTSRLLRTGDRARLRTDGQLELLGRIDDEVKIRGFKVVPNEVRGALSQHPSVDEAFVTGRTVAPGDVRLVAFVVPKPGSALRSPELRNFLRERVPEHMVPSVFVRLDALPMLPNGKVDRLALPELSEDDSLIETEYVHPSTPIEEAVAGMWGSVLGVDRVGTKDHFFELGGDSLKAMNLFLQVRMKYGVEFELRRIFDEPTVAELAASIARAKE